MAKQITEVHWKIKVGHKYYGDYVTLVDQLNPNYSEKAILKEIRTIIEEKMDVLSDQAVFTIQKVITGKTESDLLLEEGKKVLKGKK